MHGQKSSPRKFTSIGAMVSSAVVMSSQASASRATKATSAARPAAVHFEEVPRSILFSVRDGFGARLDTRRQRELRDDHPVVRRGGADIFRAFVADVNLNGSPSGWEVAKQIREVAAGFPVVYMTGASTDQWTRTAFPTASRCKSRLRRRSWSQQSRSF